MSISFSSLLKAAKRLGVRQPHRPVPTHEQMLLEHERRKGEELHRRLEHESRFLRYLYGM